MNPPTKSLLGSLAALLLAIPCTAANGDDTETRPTAEMRAAITVTVDPRVELVAITQHLSGYVHRSKQTRGRINDLDHPYLNAFRQHFAAFQDHKSIKRLGSLGIGGSAPMDLAVNMSPPNDVVLRGALDWETAHLAKAEAYVDALRAFAQATNFMAFFDANRSSYDAIIADFKQTIDLQVIADELERYCGTQPDRYTIVLAPLLGRTWFGPSATAPDGARISYAIIPPHKVVEGRLVFGSSSMLGDYICHEFGHSFVNPLVDKHWGELDKYSGLMERIRYAEGQNYGRGWKTCLYEHIDRVITARIVLRQKGEAAYANHLAGDQGRGFAFVEELCRSLEAYEQSRDRFPNLDSYFPELIRVFARLQASATPDA